MTVWDLQLVNEMMPLGLLRNDFTYSAFISACGKGALRLFVDMRQQGPQLNAITFVMFVEEPSATCGLMCRFIALRILSRK